MTIRTALAKRISVFVMAMICVSGAAFAETRLSIYSSQDCYGDGAGVFTTAVLDRDLMGGFGVGAGSSFGGVSFYGYSLSIPEVFLKVYYRIPLGRFYAVTPALYAGADFIEYTSAATNYSLAALMVWPQVSLEARVTENFSAAVHAGYALFAGNGLTAGRFRFGLAASIIFPDHMADGDLNRSLRESVASAGPSISMQESGTEVLLNISDVNFKTDSDALEGGVVPELEEIAKKISKSGIARVVVEGHTDNTGDESYNRVLSEKRAKNVADLFVKNGVPGSRVSSRGYGSARPLAPNTTAENKAKNRRVEIRLKRAQD